MDDLIRRKQALEHISAWQQANAGAETQTEYAVIESCYRMMQNLPTAYDVEAVVRELEELKKRPGKNCPLGCSSDTPCFECMIIQAIEVVKRGGRNE